MLVYEYFNFNYFNTLRIRTEIRTGPGKFLVRSGFFNFSKIRTKLRTGPDNPDGTDYPDQKSGHGPDQ